MRSNCVNCGAPVKGSTCRYCETPAQFVERRVEGSNFPDVLRAVKHCDFDDARVKSIRALSKFGGPFTAGQTRRLAECCDFDDARGQVLRALIPVTLNQSGLVKAVDIFDFDDARTEFLEALARAGVKASPFVESEPLDEPVQKGPPVRETLGARTRAPDGTVGALVPVAFVAGCLLTALVMYLLR